MSEGSENDVYIVSAKRTPIGSMSGCLSSLKAVELAGIAVKASLDEIKLAPESVDKFIMGQAVQAGSGQAPAKQASIKGGLPATCRDTLVNEVCASGMQAVILGSVQIKYLGASCIIAAGAESMSNIPYYSSRKVPVYGGYKVEDGILLDGLSDSFNSCHMGDCAEHTARKHQISREEQDNYAIESYTRANNAWSSGLMKREICGVPVQIRRGVPPTIIEEDEEYKKLDIDKVRSLKPCFDKQNGTITAANASSLSDGAAACVLMSAKAVEKYQVKPLAKLISFGEGACDPIDFATSPYDAVLDALSKAELTKDDIHLWEINEAFSVVALANMKLLALDPSKVNVNGGGVSIGHPLGMSGIRIINSLVHQLEKNQFGCASICRGGGGSAAVIIQKL